MDALPAFVSINPLCDLARAQVLAADPIKRELCLGLPVASGDSLVLQHRATGLLLCREAQFKDTDFGTEALVTAHTVTDSRRQNFLEKTAQASIPIIDSSLPVWCISVTMSKTSCGNLPVTSLLTAHYHIASTGVIKRILSFACTCDPIVQMASNTA